MMADLHRKVAQLWLVYFYNIWYAKKDDQYDRITQQVAEMAHQGLIRAIFDGLQK